MSGVLLSGRDKALYSSKSVPRGVKRIHDTHFSTQGLVFINWTEADYIQYRSVRIDAPFHVTTVIWVNESINSSWEGLVNNEFQKIKTAELEFLGEVIKDHKL